MGALESVDRMSDIYARQLEALRARSLDRHLREISSPSGTIADLESKRLINFSSNDYLGLAKDPQLREAATKAIAEFGIGAGASRLISGTQSPHLRLETALAKWKETEAALCCSSGYVAALGAIPALVDKNDVIIVDKLCHASLIDGAKLSGAALRVFPHNHLGKLKSHLEWGRQKNSAARILIITESVFSMDGDRAPLPEIVKLKMDFGAQLFLDAAHAVGVIGRNGRGLAFEENLCHEVDVQMGTLSKALGVSGGYICGSRNMTERLINRARSFIFSTAPPPALATAAKAAAETRPNEPDSPITECARTPSSGATDWALTPDFDRPSREHRPEHLPGLRPEVPALHRLRPARSHCWRTWPSGAARAFGWHSWSEK